MKVEVMPRDVEIGFLDLIMEPAPEGTAKATPSSSLKNDLGHDSQAIVGLIVALEARYCITLEGQDLNLCNFDTVQGCFRLVERYKNA
jgi:acyl carrier protein